MSRWNPTPDTDPLRQEATLRSPCVRICTLDDEDICIGCGRSLNEIKNWNAYSPGERRLRMIDCNRRRKERQRRWRPV